MAWDLWGSAYGGQDTVEGSDCVMQSEWQCDFYFGYGRDVIEENALNEKYCIQVLRIQITKADVEIDELERNLVSLQAELLFVEDEEWREVFSKALREKMDNLHISVRGLRNKSQTVTELQLSIHRDPAEKLEDILKAIVKKHIQETEEQSPVPISLESKSDTLGDSTKPSERKEQSQLEYDISVKEESGETNAPEENHGSEISLSNLQEKKTDCSEEIKVINEQSSHINTMGPNPDCLRLAAGFSDEEKNLTIVESSRINELSEVIEKVPYPDNEKIMEHESRRHEKKTCAEAAQVPNAIVEYVSLKTFIRSAAVNARNVNSEINLSTSRPEQEGDSDVDVKLVDFVRQVTGKEGIRVLKMGKVTIKPEQVAEPEVESQKAAIDFQKSHSNFVQTQQSHVTTRDLESSSQSSITAKPGIGKPGMEISLMPFVAFDKSHLNASLKPQTQRTKRKLQPESQSFAGQAIPPRKKKYIAPSLSTYKRRKDDNGDFDASLKQLLLGKHSKKSTPLEPSAKVVCPLPIAVQYPLPPPLINNPNLPLIAHTKELTIDLKFPDPCANASNIDSLGNNSNSWALISTHPKIRELKNLNVPALKAMAKKHNLNSYSKLKKDELIKFLVERVGPAIILS